VVAAAVAMRDRKQIGAPNWVRREWRSGWWFGQTQGASGLGVIYRVSWARQGHFGNSRGGGPGVSSKLG